MRKVVESPKVLKQEVPKLMERVPSVVNIEPYQKIVLNGPPGSSPLPMVAPQDLF